MTLHGLRTGSADVLSGTWDFQPNGILTLSPFLVIPLAALHEVLVILYMRGVTRGNVALVMLMTAVLAVLTYVTTIAVVHDQSMVIPATIGHVLGVPLGLRMPISRSIGCGKSDPKQG